MSKGNESKKPLRPQDFTDARNAERFARRFQDKIRYCLDRKSWFIYDGRRWRQSGGPEIRRLALEVVKSFWGELAGVKETADRYRLERAIGRCESKAAIACMVSLAESAQELEITKHKLDQHPLLLNCLNGTVDLTTGELHPHDPSDFLTMVAGAEYHPGSPCPTWESFLDRIMGGDAEMVAYLRRLAGYALTGLIREHAIYFLFGDGGNGKSCFVKALLGLLGDYGSKAPKGFLAQSGMPEHPTVMADLEGKRLVVVDEQPAGSIDETLAKVLTGSDSIKARRMREDYGSDFKPTHKLIMSSNHEPKMAGQDRGLWRRVKKIAFRVTIPENEEDRTLSDKLEAEAAGILAWAVGGCLDWQAGGMREPASVINDTADYRQSMDPVKQFLDERCALEAGAKIRANDFRTAYLSWCTATGVEPGATQSSRGFAAALARHKIGKRKSSDVIYEGVKLTG